MESKSDTPSQKPKSQPLTIIFFGTTGAGKSYHANKICDNKNIFKEVDDLELGTLEFQMEYCYFGGNPAIPIRIIDTPGFENNNGLKLSQIYKMFINFVFKYQIEFHMIVYCKIPQNEIEHLKRLMSFIRSKGLKNTYILFTHIDKVRPDLIKSLVQKYQLQLLELIRKEIPDFDATNILIPDLTSPKFWKDFIDIFYSRLEQCQGIKIRFDEKNFLNVIESTRELLHLMKTDAYKDAYHTKDKTEERKLKELVDLIDIIEGDQYHKFAQIKNFGMLARMLI